MNEAQLFDVLREGLWMAAGMSAPMLIAALVVGIVIGLLQALTSIQEMTITFVPKLAAMLVVFWVSMSFMTDLLVSFFTGSLLPLVAGS